MEEVRGERRENDSRKRSSTGKDEPPQISRAQCFGSITVHVECLWNTGAEQHTSDIESHQHDASQQCFLNTNAESKSYQAAITYGR